VDATVFFFVHHALEKRKEKKEQSNLLNFAATPPALCSFLSTSTSIMSSRIKDVLLLLFLTLSTMVASQKAWPENKKNGCLLKNKKNNYTELTGVCTSDEYSKHCTTEPDPVKCATCEQYDDATKVSISSRIVLFFFSPTLFIFAGCCLENKTSSPAGDLFAEPLFCGCVLSRLLLRPPRLTHFSLSLSLCFSSHFLR
jgi:hypothetical protein